MSMVYVVFGGIFVLTLAVGALLSRRGGGGGEVRSSGPFEFGWATAHERRRGGDGRGGGGGGGKEGELDDLSAYREWVRMSGDQSRPREVILFAYFPDRSNAERYGADMREGGFSVELLEPDAEVSEWCAAATRVAKVEPHVLLGWIDAARQSAATAGGVYDGYELEVG